MPVVGLELGDRDFEAGVVALSARQRADDVVRVRLRRVAEVRIRQIVERARIGVTEGRRGGRQRRVGIQRQIEVFQDVARLTTRHRRGQTDAGAQGGRCAQHELIGVRRLGRWREQGVRRGRAATGAEGDPGAVDVDLLFIDRPGQGAREVRHVVADGVVIAARETENLRTTVSEHVIDDTQTRRIFPVEGRRLGAVRGEMLPLLGPHARIDGQLIKGPGVLQIQALAFALDLVRRADGAQGPIDVDVAVGRAGRVREAIGVQFSLGDSAVQVGVDRRTRRGVTLDRGQNSRIVGLHDRTTGPCVRAAGCRVIEVGGARIDRSQRLIGHAARNSPVFLIHVLGVDIAALEGVAAEGGVEIVFEVQAELVAIAMRFKIRTCATQLTLS